MALVFEQIYTDGTAQLSYLIGDDSAGVAAVIDPRRDIQVYLDLAETRRLRILHAIDTHIHADFVSGVREIAARTGASVCGGAKGTYQFDLVRLNEADEIRLGSVWLRVLHTPGHTPEHICLLLGDDRHGDEPFGVFTGDTIFNLDVGRPDLRGEETEDRDARELYRSIMNKLLPIGERLEVYPGHGSGSSCGKSIGDRRITTLGNELHFSPALANLDEDAFVRRLLGDMPEPPRHYPRLKMMNAAGAEVVGGVPVAPPLELEEFRNRLDAGAMLVDTRSILAFGGGHIAGAINIGIGSHFSNWAGWMIPPEVELLLVTDSPSDAETAATHLFRLGYDDVAGYLHGGMDTWQNAALPLSRLGEWTVQELDKRREDPDVLVLDVRSDGEWEEGHVPGAHHIYIPHLEQKLDELDRSRTIATYCGSGYRSSIAASLLAKNGFEKVVNVPGSMNAWKAAGLPLAK
jgi:hydroxyacylglutathione hydrolase